MKSEKRINVGSTFEEFFACDLQPWRLNRSVTGAQNGAHAAKIASTFTDSKFGHLVINRNSDGTLTIIDGHNRLLALDILGWDEYIVTCEVFEGLTDAAIADLFTGRNFRKAMNAITTFMNELEAGHEEATAIAAILAEHGLRVAKTRSGSDTAVPAVVALRKVYRMPGVYAKRGKALRATMSLLMNAWGGGDSMSGELIEGCGMFMARHGLEIDVQSLEKRLTGYPKGPRGLGGAARGLKDLLGGSLAHNVAHIVVEQYNRGRRSGKRLPEWR